MLPRCCASARLWRNESKQRENWMSGAVLKSTETTSDAVVVEGAPWTEQHLVAAALQLGARDVAGWTAEEKELAANAARVPRRTIALLGEQIAAGQDPLGEIFSALRAPDLRRNLGATYTPGSIVDAMMAWAKAQEKPERIVDPGVDD